MSRLVEELKRRKFNKVALAYLVAARVLLEVADLLVPQTVYTGAALDWLDKYLQPGDR